MRTLRQTISSFAVLLHIFASATAAEDSATITVNSSLAPAYVLQLPESVDNILIADAASSSLRRFVRAGDRIVEKDQRYMSIGVNGMGKQRAWDRKTPLGVYFVTEEIDTGPLHEKYGVAAFALDYPNAWDRLNRRTGSGIWLHGVDRRDPDRPPRDTDGCLALPNEDLKQLKGVIEPEVTPVIVARAVDWQTPEEISKMRREFRAAVDTWKQSLAIGDLDTYLGLYASDFRFHDMDRADWTSYQIDIFASRPLHAVIIEDLMLLADPQEENLYLSRFTQVMVTDSGSIESRKRLYWRKQGDRWVIVSEESG